MTARKTPDDALLDRAAAATAKLEALLRARPKAGPSETVTDAEDTLEDPWTLHELAGPTGQVDWAVRLLPTDQALVFPIEGHSLAPAFVEQLVRQTPLLATAIQRGQLFELIGPADVLSKLRSGAYEMIPSQGGLLGGIRAVGEKKILRQARFRRVSLGASVGPQLAFAVLTAAVGAAHLAQIQRQLARLNDSVDRVLEGQESERHGQLAAAVETISEIAAQHRAVATFTPGMFHRLVAAESDLRHVHQTLRRLHEVHGTRAQAAPETDVGRMRAIFESERAVHLRDAQRLIVAVATLLAVERLLLSYESEHEPALAPLREARMAQTSERIADAEASLDHLGQLDEACRRVLDRVQDSTILHVWKRSDVEAVSEYLHDDRMRVVELQTTLRQLVPSTPVRALVPIVRVDGREGTLRLSAHTLSIESDTTD